MNGTKGAIHFEVTVSNDEMKRKLAEIRQELLNSGKTAEAIGAKVEGVFKRMAAGAGIVFTSQQALQFAKQIAVVRGEFQQLEVAFTTMLGSKGKADTLMAQMVETAAKTPFDLQSVAGGAKQLLAYGSSAEVINKELIMLGNIAAGLSIPLGDMVYLYGTTQTQGRLFTQDMRQFMGRGIPLADELAKQFGVTKERVGELVTAGKVGFPEVQKALQAMTADGGKFNNLMEEQSKTITGQISNLGDSIDVMFNKIGTSQEGLISDIIGGATSLVENYEKVGREIGALVVTYGAYKAAVISFAAAQKTVTTIKHTEEAAELAKLLTIEQQSNISKLGLAKTSAEYATAVKSEVVAEMEKQTQLAVTTNAELEASQVRLASAEGAKKRAAELVAAKKAELASVIGVAKAEQISVLEKKIAIESEKQSRAALEVVKLQSRKNDAISQAQHLKEIEASTEKIAAKNREIAVIAEKIAVSKAEEVQCSRNIVSLRAEKLALNDSIASKATLKVQAALETAQQELNTSSLARNAAAREVSSKRAVIDSAVRRANTLEMGVNTASQAANATATGFLSVAKIKLTAITAKLNAVIMANPYTIAAVAIAALAYGIYKLCTAQSAAEKAQEAFNEKIEDGKKKQDEFVSKTNELIGVIRTETNTRYMQTKAFKELNEKYPSLLKNMSMEKLLLMDNLELQKLIAQYKENKDKKELFTGLNDAQKKVEAAKKAWSDYAASEDASLIWLWKLNGDIDEAEEYLKQWQNKLKEHRQIEADARPIDVKIADLSQNITLLENQLAEIQRLQDEAKKNNPFGWNLYEFQIGAINAQISAKQGELKALNEGKAAQKEQDKNKAYWETQKKNAQDALEAMGEAKKHTKEWNAEVAKINQASSKLKQWDVSGKGDAKDANTLKKLAQEITSNQLKLEDEKIAILEDGRTKRLALSEQELAEKKAILKKEYDETVAEYKKLGKVLPEEVTTTYNQRIEVANTAKTTRDTEINKDADKELQEHQKAITDVFLNEESKRLAAIKERYDKEREWADAQFEGGNMDAEQRDNYKADVGKAQQHEELAAVLKEFETYQQKRERIAREYDEKIALLDKNTQQAIIAEAQKQQIAALAELDNSVKGSTSVMTQLFADTSQASVTELRRIINEAKAMYDYISNTKEADITAMFGLSAEQLKKIKGSPEDLEAIGKAIKKLKDDVGNDNPFQKFADDITTAIDDIKKGTKNDIGKGLTGIGNAVVAISPQIKQFGEDLSTIFGDSQIGEDIGILMDTLSGLGTAVGGVGKIMSGDIFGGVTSIVSGIANVLQSVFNNYKKKEKEIQRIQHQVDALEKSYDKLGDAIEDAYSTDAANLIEQSNEFLRQQNEQIKKQKELEQSKKKPDTAALEAYDRELDENNKKLEENKEKARDAINGTDIKSAIDDFANAYVEAWAAGEDKAASMKEVVRKMIRSAVTELVKLRLSPEVTAFMDYLATAMEGGVLTIAEQQTLDALEGAIYGKLDGLDDSLDQYMVDKEGEREASKRGIATASQESVDENNGRLTAIQGHTYAINESIKSMLPNVSSIKESMSFIRDNAAAQLEALHSIRDNTAPISEIRTEMRYMRDDINSIMMHGIKMR